MADANDINMADISDVINYQEVIDKDIFELLGLQDSTPEKKEELSMQMLDTIENRVKARIWDGLETEELNEWLDIVESGDKAKSTQYLVDKNLDIAKLWTEEALIYKTELVVLMKENNKKKQ